MLGTPCWIQINDRRHPPALAAFERIAVPRIVLAAARVIAKLHLETLQAQVRLAVQRLSQRFEGDVQRAVIEPRSEISAHLRVAFSGAADPRRPELLDFS